MRIRDNDYEVPPEIYETLSSTGYSGISMKNESDISKMYNNIRDLGYTGAGDRTTAGKIFLTETLPKLVEKIQNKTVDEIIVSSDNDLEGHGVKIIIPSNLIVIYIRLEVLLGLK